MKTDNELIAEFMGMSSFKTEHDTFWHPNEKCTPENWKYHSLDLDNFYPKSWDWLMPVVDKIESTPFSNFLYSSPGYWVVIDGDSCEIKEDKLTIITKSKGVSKIDAVYKAVVEFIKWYNQHPK